MLFMSAQQSFDVVACTLAQRLKAATQEGVKKFHLCLCLVSILDSLLVLQHSPCVLSEAHAVLMCCSQFVVTEGLSAQ